MPGGSSHAGALANDALIADRYRVERLLGQGGMGAVYVVIDTADASQRRIALKRLNVQSKNRLVGALFEREYQTLAGLKHPGIVSVYEYGTDAEGAFYTMELVEGDDLSHRAPMPWREACACLRDAASILGVLHARRLLHRDLSPRNLLRTVSGRLKLIDFGALATFGPNTDLVGTPPFVTPEALRGDPLDQRADMFALGALGYWLITGIHAFPARHLSDLGQLHRNTPALPSSLLSLLIKPGEEPVPPELDALLLSLLRIDPTTRLASTAELIDRLNAVADLKPDAEEQSAQGYLDSKVFVGREGERERVLEQLRSARAGGVRSIVLEAAPGLGRTRLMQELVVDARLAAATAVTIGALPDAQPFGAAEALALGLLNALPSEARDAALPYRTELSALSAELRARLATSGQAQRESTAGEQRVRLTYALCGWIQDLSRSRLLALFIDDVQAIDEESRALLATLSRLEGEEHLLLVVSTDGGPQSESSAALQSFRGVAARLTLLPLTAPETLALLRSVFGAAPFLERTAERLFRASGGDPSHCLELAQHLIREGLASYVDGAWTLPADLDAGRLQASRIDTQVAGLVQVSPAARQLVQVMSIPHHGGLGAADCAVLGAQPLEQTLPLLRELTLAGVLREGADGYHIKHEAVRAMLDAELSEARRSRAHLALGELRMASAQSDRVALLRASLHLFRGGELARSLAAMRVAGQRQTYATLHLTARLFEEAYLLIAARGLGPFARASALATLALASYHVDRRYARYADDALATFDQVLSLSLSRRLKRWLGGKLALIVILLITAVRRLPHRAYAPSVRELVQLCMRGFVALSGTATCCVDPTSAHRYADVLTPFLALGPRHGAGMASAMARLVAGGAEDRPARQVAGLRAMVAFIESGVPVREVTPESRLEALAGCLFCLGITACWRDDDEALQVAERLDNFSPLYAMSADYLRSNYHAGRGDIERAEHYRKRVELHAIQLGNTWQVECWAPADSIKTALRTNDALLAKRAAEAIARAASEVPSMWREERHARGTYLMLRGKYEKAIPLLQEDLEPQAVAGWARSRGSLARCHNALGQHARAKEIGLDVLGRLSEDDLAYTMMNLNVQIELALAEAGLGQLDDAARRLDQLLVRHGPHRAALTLGALHEAGCKVALSASDLTSARRHLRAMDDWYRPTGIGLLRDLVDALESRLRRAERPLDTDEVSPQRGFEPSEQLHSRVHWLLTRDAGQTLEERARRGLQLAIELSSARAGWLVFEDPAATVAWGHDGPSANLLAWAREAFASSSMDEQTERGEEQTSNDDSFFKLEGRTRYRYIPLWTGRSEVSPIAGLVLGFDGSLLQIPDPVVLRAVALHLADSRGQLAS